MVTRNLALLLRYDGTNYHGWQVQKNVPTVCETLQDALSRVVEHPVVLHGCGRTDAGVHAARYVANFHTSARIPADRLPWAMSAELPPDIAVLAARDVSPVFHSIYCCKRKEYTYYLYNRPHPNPFWARRALFYPKPLSPERFAAAATQFVGTHDFSAVRAVGTELSSTVRTVFSCETGEENGLLFFRVSANGFLYNMVRAMVGTALYAAVGKLEPEDIPGILDGGDRRFAGPTVPPHGLYMTGAWYAPPLLWENVPAFMETVF